jgi:hypothetical protein
VFAGADNAHDKNQQHGQHPARVMLAPLWPDSDQPHTPKQSNEGAGLIESGARRRLKGRHLLRMR